MKLEGAEKKAKLDAAYDEVKAFMNEGGYKIFPSTAASSG